MNPSFRMLFRRRAAILLALMLSFAAVFCSCSTNGGEKTAETDAPATSEPTPTPAPEGPFELLDYASDPGDGTVSRLAELAALIPGLEPDDRHFADAYYVGSGIELFLDLDADEFEPVLFCRVEGSDVLTVAGLRVGMELEDLKSLYPDMKVTAGMQSAYYDFSDYDGVELEIGADYRITAIIYSYTR